MAKSIVLPQANLVDVQDLLSQDANNAAGLGTDEGIFVSRFIEDLLAAFAAGYVKWNGSAFVRGDAVDDALANPFGDGIPANFKSLNLPLGTNVITHTIPANRWLAVTTTQRSNITTGAITISYYLRRAGVDYLLETASQPGRSASFSTFFIPMEPGDSLVYVTNAQGISFMAQAFLVPNTSPRKPLFLVLANGDNTVYTTPAGKVGVFTNPSYVAGTTGSPSVHNQSGGTRIYKAFAVPAAGTPSANNQMTESSVNNNARFFAGWMASFAAGESLVINTDSGAGQQVLLGTLYEFDA